MDNMLIVMLIFAVIIIIKSKSIFRNCLRLLPVLYGLYLVIKSSGVAPVEFINSAINLIGSIANQFITSI